LSLEKKTRGAESKKRLNKRAAPAQPSNPFSPNHGARPVVGDKKYNKRPVVRETPEKVGDS